MIVILCHRNVDVKILRCVKATDEEDWVGAWKLDDEETHDLDCIERGQLTGGITIASTKNLLFG